MKWSIISSYSHNFVVPNTLLFRTYKITQYTIFKQANYKLFDHVVHKNFQTV